MSRRKKKLRKIESRRKYREIAVSQTTIGQLIEDRLLAEKRDGQQIHIPLIRDLDQKKESDHNLALDNQKFYLSDSSRPWFRGIKFTHQYTELVLVTPTMASEALKFNPDNRNISDRIVEGYVRDMLCNRWIQTSETISFGIDGNVQDGQHRLKAITLANIPISLNCAFNVPLPAKAVIDSGKIRKSNDRIALAIGKKVPTKVTAIVRAMMRGSNSYAIRFTDMEIVEFAEKHQDILQWVSVNLGNVRADFAAAVAKAALWHGKGAIEPFCNRFKHLLFSDAGDPAKQIFSFITKQKNSKQVVSPLTIYRKALSALNAEIQGRQISYLTEREEDIFEWEAGWNMPQIEVKP